MAFRRFGSKVSASSSSLDSSTSSASSSTSSSASPTRSPLSGSASSSTGSLSLSSSAGSLPSSTSSAPAATVPSIEIVAPPPSSPPPPPPVLSAAEKASRARAKIAQEMLDTEQSYNNSLQVVIDHYIKPLQQAIVDKRPVIPEEQITQIFSCIEVLSATNKTLLRGLQARVCDWHDAQQVGDVFADMAPFLKSYTTYCMQFEASNDLLSKLSNTKLKRFLKKQHALPETRSLGLESYLIMPVQRIPRYVLLLQDMLRHTNSDHPDFNNLTRALDVMKAVASEINTSVAQFQSRAMLYAIEQELNVSIGLVQPHRTFVKDAVFARMIPAKSKPSQLKVYLLSDMVVFAEDGELLDRVALQVVWVYALGECEFQILCPGSDRAPELLLQAGDTEERDAWVALFCQGIDATVAQRKIFASQRAEIEAKMAKRRSLTPSERAQAEREDKARRERLKKVKSEDRFGTMRF